MFNFLKTVYPLSIYYKTKSDLDYYKKRHDELNVVLNSRNEELGKRKLEIGTLWDEKIKLVEALGTMESLWKKSVEDNQKLAELIMTKKHVEEKKNQLINDVLNMAKPKKIFRKKTGKLKSKKVD